MKPIVKGIYILFDKGEVVYVGQSDDIYRRIYEHHSGHNSRHEKKQFDDFQFWEMDDELQRDRAETLLINILCPKYNIDYAQPKRKWKPRNDKNADAAYICKEASKMYELFTNTISISDCDLLFGVPNGTFYKLIRNGEIPKSEVVDEIPFIRVKTEWIVKRLKVSMCDKLLRSKKCESP